MESEVEKQGSGTPFDHLQAGPTTHSVNRLPGFPGEKSRVVLSRYSAMAQETTNRKEC
jgi:hypothetical protein